MVWGSQCCACGQSIPQTRRYDSRYCSQKCQWRRAKQRQRTSGRKYELVKYATDATIDCDPADSGRHATDVHSDADEAVREALERQLGLTDSKVSLEEIAKQIWGLWDRMKELRTEMRDGFQCLQDLTSKGGDPDETLP